MILFFPFFLPETVMHSFSEILIVVFVGPTSPAIGTVVKASDYVMPSHRKIYDTDDWLLQLLCTKYGEILLTKWQKFGGICANRFILTYFGQAAG